LQTDFITFLDKEDYLDISYALQFSMCLCLYLCVCAFVKPETVGHFPVYTPV